jgi:hypothetical protein
MRTVGVAVVTKSPSCPGAGTIGGRKKNPWVPPLWSWSEMSAWAPCAGVGAAGPPSPLHPASNIGTPSAA